MAEKVTTMVLKIKVDLQCSCCYKKVKKVLSKFPQIKTQVYDEKANTVTITVECCSPEKFRDKLCCKGGKLIISIEIIKPPPTPTPTPTPAPVPAPAPAPTPTPKTPIRIEIKQSLQLASCVQCYHEYGWLFGHGCGCQRNCCVENPTGCTIM